MRLRVRLANGRVVEAEKRDYEGFTTRPMGWEGAARKFHGLASRFAAGPLRERLVDTIARLDRVKVTDLTALLSKVGNGQGKGRR